MEKKVSIKHIEGVNLTLNFINLRIEELTERIKILEEKRDEINLDIKKMRERITVELIEDESERLKKMLVNNDLISGFLNDTSL